MITNTQPAVDINGETDYVARASRNLNGLLKTIAYVVGGIMGLGAMFGAANTMYTAISNRKREIAILRAIRFGTFAIVISVLVEALVLASIGAAIGVTIARPSFNNNLHAMGGTVVRLAAKPALMTGLNYAGVLAVIACLIPYKRGNRLQMRLDKADWQTKLIVAVQISLFR